MPASLRDGGERPPSLPAGVAPPEAGEARLGACVGVGPDAEWLVVGVCPSGISTPSPRCGTSPHSLRIVPERRQLGGHGIHDCTDGAGWCRRSGVARGCRPRPGRWLAFPFPEQLRSTRPRPGSNDRDWGELGRVLERVDGKAFLAGTGFRGEVGETRSVLLEGHHILAVGVGPTGKAGRKPGAGSDTRATNDDLRSAGAALSRAAARLRSVATTLHTAGDGTPGAAQAVVEGMVLAGYHYRPSPAGREQLLEQVTLVGQEQVAATGARVGRVTAEATLRARRWADQPAGELSPRAFAAAAAEAGAAAGLEVENLGRRAHRRRAPRLPGQRGRRVGRTSPSGAPHLCPARCPCPGGAGRQGDHLRLRRTVAQGAGVDGDDERGHGWCGGRVRRHVGLA